MSKSYGLAKKATAIAVRVLNAGGSGSFAWVISYANAIMIAISIIKSILIIVNFAVTCSGVIAGVDWSADDHKNAGPTKKSVAK